MTAIGIDLGGTKCETRLFGPDWQTLETWRVPTPDDYAGLLDMLADVMGRAEARAGARLPIGIGAAGRLDAEMRTRAANMPSEGRPLPADLRDRTGRDVIWMNDADALAVAEARQGAGRGVGRVLAIVMGTGVGAGVAENGRLRRAVSGVGGEIGHTALPAPHVRDFDLPLLPCGCGRTGCAETLIAGPGMTRLAHHMTGRDMDPVQIGVARDHDVDVARVWTVWRDLAAELLLTQVLALDPDIILLAGGLSRLPGLAPALEERLAAIQLPGFPVPPVRPAEGGAEAGALGAALEAVAADG